MSDFDRLLNLAQKSNGKVFIYDKSEGRHMLLVDLDEYEDFLNFHDKLDKKMKKIKSLENFNILDDEKDFQIFNQEKSQEDEVKIDNEIEKVNNDIANWKLKEDEKKKQEEEKNIEEELLKEDWHSISKILEEKNNLENKNKIDELMEIKEETEEINYDKKNIPFVSHEEELDTNDLDEEEPIFFEEPV